MQNIFIYIDDSGVFDKKNNSYFVYAGYIFFSTNEKQNAARKYLSVEKSIRENLGIDASVEMKSYILDAKHKNKLYRSMNEFNRFTNVIDCNRVMNSILADKKHKQRFLDYTLKRTIKDTLLTASSKNLFDIAKPAAVRIFFDEHTTATSGLYEFRECVEAELIKGTFNYNYRTFYKPILSRGSQVELKLCNSAKNTLVRASDLVANKAFYLLNYSGKQFSEVVSDLNHLKICLYP